MLTRIKKWLEHPNFPGEVRKTAQAQIINTVGQYFVLTLLVGATILVPFFVRYKIVSWVIILALAIVYAISRVFLFRGRLVLSMVLMIVSAWALGVGVSIFGGGIASPMLYIVLADTIIVGYLLQTRIGTSLVLASTVIVLGLAVLEKNGFSLPLIFNFSPIATWFMFALALWFVYAVMTLIKASLLESERRFRSITENVQVGFHIYHLEDINDDRSLRMVNANPASENLTGIRSIDIVGKTIDENFPNLRQLGIPQKYAEVVRMQMPGELGDVLYSDERMGSTSFSVKAFPLPDQHVGIFFEDVTKRKQAEEMLINLARTDALTGLHNRHYFFELAEKEIERAKRYKNDLSCIIFDIDNFKQINDTYGHLIGDKAMQEVARCCQKDVRQIDIPARHGGDEFVILLPETSYQEALIVVERIYKCIGKLNISASGEKIKVSLSAGIAELKTVKDPTLNELLSAADQALYQSKESGKDRTTVWQETKDQYDTEN